MKVLIAPDKFKDALDAPQAAAAMAAGVRDARPSAGIRELPLADGGEGSGPILAQALGAVARTLTVQGPLGQPRPATWWWSQEKQIAIIEMAEAAGLRWLEPAQRRATRTSTYGVGQLLLAAAALPARQILVCVGGSATVDGGAGCLQALGWTALDQASQEIREPLSGGTLLQVVQLRPPLNCPGPLSSVTVLADVDNALLGREGAARVFGPQKGASPTEVELLDAGLRHWASLLSGATGRVVHAMRHGGAAGGLPAGLAAALGAKCEPGFDVIAKHAHVSEHLKWCDVCLTGEGRLDSQSAGGKTPVGVARLAREADRPVVALVGHVQPPAGETQEQLAARLGFNAIRAISDERRSLSDRLASTAEDLRAAAAAHFRRA